MAECVFRGERRGGGARFAFALFVFLFIASNVVRASEGADRLQDEAAALAGVGDFDRLDARWQQLRETRERTPGGDWALAPFSLGALGGMLQNAKTEPEFAAARERAARWTKHAPRSAAAHVTFANVLVQAAWNVRGSGYSSTVSDDAMRAFHRTMREVAAYLDEHRDVLQEDPGYYTTMFDVAKVESWPREKFRALYDEATAKFPAYAQLDVAAVEYYTPKWGGNFGLVDAFSRAAEARTAATDGSSFFGRVYWSVFRSSNTDDFNVPGLDRKHLIESLKDLVARYPTDFNEQALAYFACWSRDVPTARDTLPKFVYFEDGLNPIWPTHCRNSLDQWEKDQRDFAARNQAWRAQAEADAARIRRTAAPPPFRLSEHVNVPVAAAFAILLLVALGVASRARAKRRAGT